MMMSCWMLNDDELINMMMMSCYMTYTSTNQMDAVDQVELEENTMLRIRNIVFSSN